MSAKLASTNTTASMREAVERVEWRNKIRAKHEEKCVYCGCTNPLYLTIDHKLPIIRGGTDDEQNLTIACFPCNSLKGALTTEEFEKYMKGLLVMHDLKKLKIAWPERISLVFSSHHYPSFPADWKKEQQQKDNGGECDEKDQDDVSGPE